MKRKYYYDMLVSAPDNAQLMGESTRLVCVQLKERDFDKNVFNKSYGDFQQLLCQNQFQRDVHCAKNISMTFQYFDVFLHFCSWV